MPLPRIPQENGIQGAEMCIWRMKYFLLFPSVAAERGGMESGIRFTDRSSYVGFAPDIARKRRKGIRPIFRCIDVIRKVFFPVPEFIF